MEYEKAERVLEKLYSNLAKAVTDLELAEAEKKSLLQYYGDIRSPSHTRTYIDVSGVDIEKWVLACNEEIIDREEYIADCKALINKIKMKRGVAV